MPASLTLEKVFTDEPYRSIMNLLIEFKDEGLTLKEIHYALSPKHYLKYGLKALGEKLDEKVKALVDSRKLIKYEIKSIERKKRKKQTGESIKEEKAKLIRSNVINFLLRLKDPKVGAIYKDKKKYKINKDFYYESLRLRVKEDIDCWKTKFIDYYHVKNPEAVQGHIAYFGISTEISSKLTKGEKEAINDHLQNISESVSKIKEIRDKKVKQLYGDSFFDERINKFIDNLKSESSGIADFFKKLDEHDKKLYQDFQMSEPVTLFLLFFNFYTSRSEHTKKDWYDFTGFSQAHKNIKWSFDIISKERLELDFKDAKKLIDGLYNYYDVFLESLQNIYFTLVWYNSIESPKVELLKTLFSIVKS